MHVAIDRFGRILIPKNMREEFNLEPGTSIRIQKGKAGIELIPVHEEPNLHLKEGVLVYSGKPLDDLADAVARLREERSKTVSGK